MDIDFWGVVHGSKEFLPYLAASGDGRLVNISSLFGLMAVPGQSAYNAAKFAVRGLTEALRQEMVLSGTPVQVTCVHPGGIKTAIARNARAVGTDQARAAALFDKKLARMAPERAAEIIVDAMVAGKPRVLVGSDAKALDLLVRVLGSGYQRVVSASASRATRGLRR
jgi:short-subunit dehydrogenase